MAKIDGIIRQLLRDITGQTIDISPTEPQKIDIPESILDISLAQKYIFFEPHFSMREGLVKTLQHHKILTSGDK